MPSHFGQESPERKHRGETNTQGAKPIGVDGEDSLEHVCLRVLVPSLWELMGGTFRGEGGGKGGREGCPHPPSPSMLSARGLLVPTSPQMQTNVFDY